MKGIRARITFISTDNPDELLADLEKVEAGTGEAELTLGGEVYDIVIEGVD